MKKGKEILEAGLNPKTVARHFDNIAGDYDKWKQKNYYYYNNIMALVKSVVSPGSAVLEIGCATGKILASTNPSLGVGIDISSEMVKLAKEKFPQHNFFHSSIEELKYEKKFDYILMIDLVDHVYDIAGLFENVHKFCHPNTKIVLTAINPWWEPILSLMAKIGVKMPEGPNNFIEKRSLFKIIAFLDFFISYSGHMLLFPKNVPILSFLANSIGTRTWGINKLSFVQYMIFRPSPKNTNNLGLGCSVIIPCYNEADNIEEAIRRIPKMGKETEIIVVSDGSKDNTADVVRGMKKDYPNLKLIDYSPNRGKGYAVKTGFDAATQEVIMVFDADMSVPPEELPRFFEPLNKGICDFVNGTRMIYLMESQSMKFLNLLGNKIFGRILSFIMDQDITDTLCGTKALYKKDYRYIKMGRDRWGDFDLLFGAAKLRSTIMEVPVHYMTRKAGESKMKTFRHGFHLLNVCFRGFGELILRRFK